VGPNSQLPKFESPRALLRRLWTNPSSTDSNNRERQLAIDFIAAAAEGPTLYLGRDIDTKHKGMGINKNYYLAFGRHLGATMEKFNVAQSERSDLMNFIVSLESDIVEA